MREDQTSTYASNKAAVNQWLRKAGDGCRSLIGRPASGRRLGSRRVLGLWMVALLALLGMTGPNVSSGPVTPRAYLPIGLGAPNGTSKGFQWAFVGINQNATDTMLKAVVDGFTRYNYFTWSTYCDDPFDPTPSKIGLQRHIPVIWGAKVFNDATVMDQLFNGQCNDGRPLLFLNEPEMADEANIAPDVAADMFYKMTRGSWSRSRWRGPIYGGGIINVHEEWVDKFLDTFATRYNNGSRSIPEIAGWHLHMYANFDGLNGDPPLNTMTDSAFQSAVSREGSMIAGFIQHRRAEGNATKIYVDEMGLLKRLNGSTKDGTPAQYAERMAVLLRMQDAMLRGLRPDVEGYQWFSVYQGDPYCSSCIWLGFTGSNVVFPDGTLNTAGRVWRELAAASQ
jgi:hypothetical protein